MPNAAVISLDRYREQRTGSNPGAHDEIIGDARCLACGHLHHNFQIAPGVIGDACCDACDAQRLVWLEHVQPPRDMLRYRCAHCRGLGFTILENGYLCQGCGAMMTLSQVHGRG